MQRDIPDVFRVSQDHEAIHSRLLNWALWVTPRPMHWMHPMWRKSRSNAFQWHSIGPSVAIDTLKAAEMEKAICALPQKHRHAIRWWYVWRYGELKVRRELGLTHDGLVDLLHAARCMLTNRGI